MPKRSFWVLVFFGIDIDTTVLLMLIFELKYMLVLGVAVATRTSLIFLTFMLCCNQCFFVRIITAFITSIIVVDVTVITCAEASAFTNAGAHSVGRERRVGMLANGFARDTCAVRSGWSSSHALSTQPLIPSSLATMCSRAYSHTYI